jgi:hypothetical protein
MQNTSTTATTVTDTPESGAGQTSPSFDDILPNKRLPALGKDIAPQK